MPDRRQTEQITSASVMEQVLNLKILERLAALEPQVSDLKGSVESLRVFKEEVISQIAELKHSINLLTWKVGLIMGGVIVVVNQLANWGFKKLLP